MNQLMRVAIGIPFLAVFFAMATVPLWFRFYKSWASDYKSAWFNFWGKVKENAGLGIQTNLNLTDMAIRLTFEHYKYLSYLYQGHLPFFKEDMVAAIPGGSPPSGVTYQQFVQHPSRFLKDQYRHVGSDGIVYVGPSWFKYRTVRDWALTPKHRLALNIDAQTTGVHTIPMTVQTTPFGMIGLKEGDPEVRMTQAKYEKRMEEVMNSPTQRLNPSEEWMLFVLEIPETADGFSVPTSLEIDWLIGDPWESQTKPGKDNIGVLLLSHLNAALRRATKRLDALEVSSSTDDADVAKSAIQSRLEQAIWEEFGLASDGSTGGHWNDRINDHTNHTSLAVLARNGLLVLRVRIANMSLPQELKTELQKPAKARAQMGSDLITAEGRLKIAGKDADTLRTRGAGERDYQILNATGKHEGERLIISAYSGDGKTVDAAANSFRAIRGAQETWQAGVSSAADGKVVVVGNPGATTDPIAGAVAALTAITSGIKDTAKTPPVEKPKGESKPEPGDGGTPEEPPNP